MPHVKKRAKFSQRAVRVRDIAQGIYDKTERRVVLNFVTDAERLVAVAPPNVILTVLGDDKPKH